MRKPLLTAAIAAACLIFVLGCSREEQSQKEAQKAVVKKAIVQTQKIQIETKPAEKKASDPGPPAQAEESRQALMAKAEEETKAEPSRVQPASKPEPRQARVSAEKRPQPAAGSASGDSQDFYVVQSGDTLARIAGKKEVFRDPLKWAVLYRLNATALDALPGTDNLPDLPLPAEMKLRLVTPEETRGRIEKRTGGVWVVNVLSATNKGEIIPAVITLSKKEYPVYVSSAKVNEKDWMRVRVGFFKTREEAETEGKKIKEMLDLKDIWVTKMPKSEFMEFAGF